jgi:hypothetical protein
MKLFFVGGAVGFVIGMAITVMYFSLATLFAANAKFSASRSERHKVTSEGREIALPEFNEKAQGVGA